MINQPAEEPQKGMYLPDAVALYDTCPAPNYKNTIKFIRKSTVDIGSAFDVGCGTGSIIKMLRADGWDAHGCDISEPMVMAARKKNPAANIRLQSAIDFSAGKKVNLITCTFDVLNHLDDKSMIRDFFARAFSQLQPGGLLIFDSLSPSDINNNWDRYVEVDSWDDLYLIRKGKKVAPGKGILTYEFFKKVGYNHWFKSTEIHTLIAPSFSWIDTTLRKIGFHMTKALDATDLAKPDSDTVRWIFSAVKPLE